MRFEDLTGASVVVWGAGREGRAAVEELTRRGVRVSLAITGAPIGANEVSEDVAAGEAGWERLRAADVVVKSPGVPHTSPEYRHLRAAGTPVTSLTDLWLNDNAHRVLAVTGTKGKSTTTALADHLLRAVGRRSALVGNGGVPVTTGDPGPAAPDVVAVAEVSSYQAADLTVSPRVAVLTSLYPEHLPWHGGYEAYVADKLNLIAHGPETVVVPDGPLRDLVAGRVAPDVRLLTPTALGITVDETGLTWQDVGAVAAAAIPLPGRHNHLNVALALTAVTVFAGLGETDGQTGRRTALRAVETFTPLAHRLEQVPSTDGRRWIDDSLATAPEAVVAALRVFEDDARVVLVVGGADRGLPFAPLLDHLAGSAVEVVATGPAGARLQQEAREAGAALRLTVVTDFAEAMRHAHASPAEVVLLSPGAPSFDEFADFAAKSAAFRAAAAAGG